MNQTNNHENQGPVNNCLVKKTKLEEPALNHIRLYVIYINDEEIEDEQI